jgi:MFS family permease
MTRTVRSNVVLLGAVAFWSGLAQEMVYPLLPVFVVVALGGSKTALGAIEGALMVAVATSRLGSGWLASRGSSLKRLTAVAYAISLVSRPLLAVAPSVGAVVGLRIADGIGKGGKDAPRDTLVAAAAATATGRAFGIQRMLDTLGSVAGPLVAAAVLLAAGQGERGLRIAFALAAIPGVLAMLTLRRVVDARGDRGGGMRRGARQLPRTFYVLLAATVLFGLANSSDTLLLLRAQTAGVGVVAIPVLYAGFNLVYASLAIPLGTLADRIGKRPVLVAAWLVYAGAYTGFAFAAAAWQVVLLFLLYGGYYAAAEGTAKAWIASLVPAERRAVAYALNATAAGLLVLPAGLLAGWLWDSYGYRPAFLTGGAIAAVAALLLLVVRRPPGRSTH